ncbi:hypothetical protein M0802_004548 [Mischocyttarus mexicanus]|nr:hypothetical protein M0802_004548 [Mischocyttarus mexicanus]
MPQKTEKGKDRKSKEPLHCHTMKESSPVCFDGGFHNESKMKKTAGHSPLLGDAGDSGFDEVYFGRGLIVESLETYLDCFL